MVTFSGVSDVVSGEIEAERIHCPVGGKRDDTAKADLAIDARATGLPESQ
jgi:hypothetical protein